MRSFFFVLVFLLGTVLNSRSASLDTPPTPPTPPAPAPVAPQAIIQMLRDASKLLAVGDDNGALAKVNAALAADPRSTGGYLLRGAIYTGQKKWTEGEKDFETAHLLDPTNKIIDFNLAEIKFNQKQYDTARVGFAQLIATNKDSEIADIASYKIFLCDLLGRHEALAQKELDAFNEVGEHASYYYANIAWDLYHHKTEDARSWLASATHIYSPQKNGFYMTSLTQLGYLPLPPPPAAP